MAEKLEFSVLDLDDDSCTSSDEENQQLKDEDTCSMEELEKEFVLQYEILHEEAVSLKKAYVLHLAADEKFTKIAAGISDGVVQIFNINEFNMSRTSFKNPITSRKSINNCGVKFVEDDPNILLTGTTDGSINLYDLRTNDKQHTFEDTSDNQKKTITCFDSNANGRVICAGTDKIVNDAFLLFYDIRQKSLLGGYWQSHQDDITQVKFHPNNPDLMCSGSTDGLINIFDISNSTEDDALSSTINTESSVHKLNWHYYTQKDKEIISCITHTNDFHMYNVQEGDLTAQFTREDITNALKRKSIIDCNLINCHNTDSSTMTLLAGSNYNKGETVRNLKIFGDKLCPLGNFNHNKQILRDSLFDQENYKYITSGESGIISYWAPRDAIKVINKTNLKLKTKIGGRNVGKKPY